MNTVAIQNNNGLNERGRKLADELGRRAQEKRRSEKFNPLFGAVDTRITYTMSDYQTGKVIRREGKVVAIHFDPELGEELLDE